ncbi:unnamed protein product [Chrysoparadoxa australica]
MRSWEGLRLGVTSLLALTLTNWSIFVGAKMEGKVLKGKWEVGSFIGEGACAQVYEVKDVKGAVKPAIPLVIKICPLPAAASGKKRKKTPQQAAADTLYYENMVYQGYLLGFAPKPIVPPGGYGEDQGYRYMVMQRLGNDLNAAYEEAKGKKGEWTVADIANLGRDILASLRALHCNHKMVFVDVKPENFLFGHPSSKEKGKVFLVDFGIAERYTGKGGVVKPQTMGVPVGTPEYLSEECHGGASAGRKDDLEALGYILIQFLRGGDLPWSGAKSDAEGLRLKKGASLASLCQSYQPMEEYISLARSTPYDAEPDYDAFDKCLQRLAKEKPKATPAAAAAATGKRKKEKKAPVVVEVEDDEDKQKCPGTTPKAKRRGKAKDAATRAAPVTPRRGRRGSLAPPQAPASNLRPEPATVMTGSDVRLMVVEGKHKGLDVILRTSDGEQILGAGAEAHVALPLDEKVSETHCRIEAAAKGLKLKDLGSTNGTKVNGKVIKRARTLKHEDVIEVGSSRLVVMMLSKEA